MAHGYFRSETTNVQTVVEAWLKDHPRAIVETVVSGGPVTSRLPASKQAFVWITEGTNNLNVEMVRLGCFSPETQMLKEDEKLEVPQQAYDAFLRKIVKAGEQAKTRKAGIWREIVK